MDSPTGPAQRRLLHHKIGLQGLFWSILRGAKDTPGSGLKSAKACKYYWVAVEELEVGAARSRRQEGGGEVAVVLVLVVVLAVAMIGVVTLIKETGVVV